MAIVLVVGSGGREHALAWKISQSLKVSKVIVAPGNGGQSDGELESKITNNGDVPVNDHQALADWCIASNISLVVVGSEVPLANGINDVLTENGVRCFGPSQQASALESSKEFAKEFMVKYDIPTARFRTFRDVHSAIDHIKSAEYPALVVKASGLAAGKGVVVCDSKEEACKAVRDILEDNIFGPSGKVLVIEELLTGEEFSVLCFTDGESIAVMPPIQDHKRVYEGDTGPNTGGMGAYGPCPQISPDSLTFIHTDVLQRAVDGMRKDGKMFVGVLYAGIMVTDDGPRVLEFNCRFGDPECQVLLSLLDSDLYDIMMQCCEGRLNVGDLTWKDNASSACIVLASNGYPGKYEKGTEIIGIEEVNSIKGLKIFEAGTTLNNEGVKVTSGGRVLSVCSTAASLKSALGLALEGAEKVKFKGSFYRRDIGWRGIDHIRRKPPLTYAACGVNISNGDAFVKKISPLAAVTSRKGCDAVLGGFGALFDLSAVGYSNPVLVSGTDGVGTKLLLAQEANLHSTIGQDLVAMCVNDILTHNAEPLFFLDYFSCGKLNCKVANEVMFGISQACKMTGCALVGGETAEMPGMYTQGQYDLAGFAVGAYDKILHTPLPKMDKISSGDVVIGISSTGIHSNGFSLVREVIRRSSCNTSNLSPFDPNVKLIDSLLTPTAIYTKALLPVLRTFKSIKAVAHITGGGIPGNLSRVIPDGFCAVLDAKMWRVLPVFGWLAKTGSVSPHEMLHTFNCGLGMCVVVSESDKKTVFESCQQRLLPLALDAFIVGHVEEKPLLSEKVIVRNFASSLNKSWATGCNKVDVEVPQIQKNSKPSVAIFISGSGTNLQALIDHYKSGKAFYEIALVISNNFKAGGLQRANSANIACEVLDHRDFKNREEYDFAVHKVLVEKGIQFICLAGFMRLLSGWFTRMWSGRILNVHPSLLPSFRGMDAHEQVLKSGVRVTGCTVHFVTEKMDEGAVVAQTAVEVKRTDDVDSLSERVKLAEHRTYPNALDLVVKGEAVFDAGNNRVIWKQ